MYTLVLLTNNKLTSIKILNHILEIVYLRIQYRQQKYCYTAKSPYCNSRRDSVCHMTPLDKV